MKITLNGEAYEVFDGTNIQSLLEEKSLKPETVVVEMDGEIIPPNRFKDTRLYEGVTIEVLRFVGGG